MVWVYYKRIHMDCSKLPYHQIMDGERAHGYYNNGSPLNYIHRHLFKITKNRILNG